MKGNDLATTRSNMLWELCCREVAAASGVEWPAADDWDGRAKAIARYTMSHGSTLLALHERVMPQVEAMALGDPLVLERLLPEVLLGELHRLQQEVG